MPGFVDTHRHTWQTPFRGVCADWTLEEYFRGIRMTISPAAPPTTSMPATSSARSRHWTPASRRSSTSRTATTPPSTPTPRCRACATPGSVRSSPTATYPAPGRPPAFADQSSASPTRGAPRTELARRRFARDDGRRADRGRACCRSSRRSRGRSARGWVCRVLHTGCSGARHDRRAWPSSSTTAARTRPGPRALQYADDRDLRRLADAGCKVSSSPETELQMGMGHPVIGRALAQACARRSPAT